MSNGDLDADPFGIIADTFVEDFRCGRDPQIEDYVERFPEYSEQIRELLPTLALMERVKSPEASGGCESSDARAMVGRRLGDYQILREIGRGGMGVVFEAEQISLGRHVAIKVLPQRAPLNDNQHVRFAREAKAAASLHHTNIVPIFGVGKDDGLHYYVMQYINGLGLDEVLRQLRRIRQCSEGEVIPDWRQSSPSSADEIANSLLSQEGAADKGAADGASNEPKDFSVQLEENITGGLLVDPSKNRPTSSSSDRSPKLHRGTSSHGSNSTADPYWRNVARIGLQVSDALVHAHEQGIAHRDIKPSNLLLDIQNTVWVTDFGLAKHEDEANITRSGDILGTIRYMPPEAFDGNSDARSDIYSLGITLYELATLTPAFGSSDRREMIKQVMSGQYAPVTKVAPQIPRDLATIITKASERDVNDRYATASELHEDLRRFMDDEPIHARRASLPERWARWARQNRALAASVSCVVGLLTLIAIGGVVASVYFLEQKEVQRTLYRRAQSMANDNGRLLIDLESALDQSIRSGRDAEKSRQQAIQQTDLTRRSLYSANMLNARTTVDGHRGFSRTQSLLDQWRPEPGEVDQRGWEWYYIQSLCNQHEFQLDGDQEVFGLTIAGDGIRFASAGADQFVRVWHSRDKSLVAELPSPVGTLYSVAWDPLDRFLVAGGTEGMAVWEVGTWRPLEFPSGKSETIGLQWSPNGEWLARIQRPIRGDQGIALLQRDTFEPIHALPGRCNIFFGAQLSWSADGNRIAYPVGRSFNVWDLESKKSVFQGVTRSEHVNAVCFHPHDPNLIVECSRDAIARTWDLSSGKELMEFVGHTHGISRTCWFPDGNRLATSSWDGTVRIWDSISGRMVEALHGHRLHVFALDWLPDLEQLLSAGYGGSIKCWRPDRVSSRREFGWDERGMHVCRFSPDGDSVAICTTFGGLFICDANDGEIRHRFDGGASQLRSIAYSPDGTRLVSVGKGSVRLWDTRGGTRLAEYTTDSTVQSVDWCSSGDMIALGLRDGAIELLDETLRPVEKRIESGLKSIATVKFNPLATKLAIGGAGGMRMLDLATGDVDVWHVGSQYVDELEWSRDGSKIALAKRNHVIGIWDVASREERVEMSEHFEPVFALAWGPDDRRLLSVDARGTMILWDSESGQPTLNVRCATGEYRSADWSQSGTQIAVGSNRRIVLFDASRGYQAETSRLSDGEH